MELGPAMPDRWRIVQALGYKEQIWNPYEGHNPLKGDLPIWGDDWFFSITAVSDTLVEPRRFPVPVGVATTDRPASLDLITEGESTILNQQLLTEFVLYQGDTTFRPIWLSPQSIIKSKSDSISDATVLSVTKA